MKGDGYPMVAPANAFQSRNLQIFVTYTVIRPTWVFVFAHCIYQSEDMTLSLRASTRLIMLSGKLFESHLPQTNVDADCKWIKSNKTLLSLITAHTSQARQTSEQDFLKVESGI